MTAKKKILALVMAAALIFTLLPAAAFAGDSPPGDGSTPGAEDTEAVVKPVSAQWGFGYIRGILGTDIMTNLDTPDVFSFNVTYDDGSSKEFIYNEYPFIDESGEENIVGAFYAEGEDPAKETSSFYPYLDEDYLDPIEFKEGWNDVKLVLNVPYVLSGEGTADEIVDYEQLYVDTRVLCMPERPLEVVFVPAEGFTARCCIGFNYLTEECFYGEGNAFKVKHQHLNPETGELEEYFVPYYYAKGTTEDGSEEEGFFFKGKTDLDRFEFTEGIDCYLEKGTHEVEFTYDEYVDDLGDVVSLTFTGSVTADKYNAYTNLPEYAYTGSVIKPKFKVYNSDDELIPATEYTYTAPSNKKMGWYDVTINFKDTEKYVDSIVGTYGIGPQAPKLSKVVRGKKSLTVQWKKLTKAQLKNIDGMYIEIATDKDFWNGYKRIKLNKNAVKKGKRVIKKLKKNKKYYVRMYAYKKITQDGYKFPMDSKFSKVIAKKTK